MSSRNTEQQEQLRRRCEEKQEQRTSGTLSTVAGTGVLRKYEEMQEQQKAGTLEKTGTFRNGTANIYC